MPRKALGYKCPKHQGQGRPPKDCRGCATRKRRAEALAGQMRLKSNVVKLPAGSEPDQEPEEPFRAWQPDPEPRLTGPPPRAQVSPEERARMTPAGLARLTVPNWRLLPVTNLINRVFMLVALASLRPYDRALDQYRRVILCLPPRTGKSEICSINGVAWYLGHNPDMTVAIGSYAAEFAEGFGKLSRDVLQSFGAPVFGVVTDPSSEAKNWWGTYDYHAARARRGGLRALGIDGQWTGKGFNLVVVDDPFKSAQSVLSPSDRRAAQTWWDGTLKSRLEPGAAVLVVQQRMHEDDLAGYLMRTEGLYTRVGRDGWTPVVLPLRAEPITKAHVPGLEEGETLPDPLGREPGELLLTRYSAEELAAAEKTTSEFFWNAQYQQRPTVPEGTLFLRDSLRYYEVLPQYFRLRKAGITWLVAREECMYILTTDLAASMKTRADFFTVAHWAVTRQRDLLLLNVVRGKFEGPDQDAILEGAWNTASPRPAFLAVEAAGYQLTMVQRLRRKGIAVRPVQADRDKYSRATVAATRLNNEGIFLPSAPTRWKTDWIEEHLNFPNGAHDDQVDTTAYACILIEPRGMSSGANIRVVG